MEIAQKVTQSSHVLERADKPRDNNKHANTSARQSSYHPISGKIAIRQCGRQLVHDMSIQHCHRVCECVRRTRHVSSCSQARGMSVRARGPVSIEWNTGASGRVRKRRCANTATLSVITSAPKQCRSQCQSVRVAA